MSPTIPKSAISKIGASGSLFIATIMSAEDIPAAAFLWLLSDDYVTPTPTSEPDVFGIILAGSALTGIFIVAVVIIGLRRKSP